LENCYIPKVWLKDEKVSKKRDRNKEEMISRSRVAFKRFWT